MEQITNSQNKASSSSSKWNIKKMFWWLLFWTLLLASCSDGKKDLPTTEPSISEIEEVKPESIPEPRDIQETWEYKIYKLWLGSIVPIKWDIQKAKEKIANNSELAQLLTWKDVEFETVMPSIIKESMMNRDAKSNSWAVGYFQLKPIAVKDVVDVGKPQPDEPGLGEQPLALGLGLLLGLLFLKPFSGITHHLSFEPLHCSMVIRIPLTKRLAIHYILDVS